MRRRDPSSIRLARALAAGAVALVAAASIAAAAPASPARTMGGVRFVLQFQGSFVGSWHTINKRNDISGYKCGGSDSWGTFKSSVRPTSKPWTVVAATDLGGTKVYLDWGPSSGMAKGVVTSTRTAAGWMLDYDKGACLQVPHTASVANCGARTFSGEVGLIDDSRLTRNIERVFLDWELEPESARLDCMDGRMWGTNMEEDARTTLDLRKLHRCGTQKPRGCRFTIRGSHVHSHSITQPTPDGATIDAGNGRFEWSVTFVARGRR